jgi:hypothetical protein
MNWCQFGNLLTLIQSGASIKADYDDTVDGRPLGSSLCFAKCGVP